MTVADQTSYESIAEQYLSGANDKWIMAHYERPYMTAHLPNVTGRTVLDLGCATGYYTKYCLDRGADVICVDASRKMVENTVTLCDGKVRGYVHDIAQPFTFLDSASIDVVVCSLVLHYVENWEATLNECHRVLKNGGRCIVSTHHPVNDYRHFNQDCYFSRRLIEDEWINFDPPLQVKYFVRPLSEYIQPMIACKLDLIDVAEPMPIPQLAKLDQAAHDRASKRPLFLFFVLEKEGETSEGSIVT